MVSIGRQMVLLWIAYLLLYWLAIKVLSNYQRLYERYMDDILRTIERELKTKLAEINDYHPSLWFTMDEEKDGKLPVLDLLIIKNGLPLKLQVTTYLSSRLASRVCITLFPPCQLPLAMPARCC